MATMMKEKYKDKKKNKSKTPKETKDDSLASTSTKSDIIAEMADPQSLTPFKDLEKSVNKTDLMENTITVESNSLKENIEKINEDLNSTINLETTSKEEIVKIKLDVDVNKQNVDLSVTTSEKTDLLPSAPVLKAPPVLEAPAAAPIVQEEKLSTNILEKNTSMPIEDAIRIFGGKEMLEVIAISEREEALIEAGPLSGPDHPLLDLLCSLRSSLKALERDKIQLLYKFQEEQSFRSNLWKVERQSRTVSKDCPCGQAVSIETSYESAIFLKQNLPVAKMKLESILKEVQESYCHLQHAALLTYCQIEDFISDVVQRGKHEIREALTLVLQELRSIDSSMCTVLAELLQRWAANLTSALVDSRDLRQLIFVLHHLLRQNRSVKWVSRFIDLNCSDNIEVAKNMAILDLLFNFGKLEPARECTEGTDEGWEEVYSNSSGAVSDGALRERDMLSILYSFPLRMMVARLLMFSCSDLRYAHKYAWGDPSGGQQMLKSVLGVRSLLALFHRVITTKTSYKQLHKRLRCMTRRIMTGLAYLHSYDRHDRSPCYKNYQTQLESELHAVFRAGFEIVERDKLHRLPTSLLSDQTAKDYVILLMLTLHDNTKKSIQYLDVDIEQLDCRAKMQIIAYAAAYRDHDDELARIVIQFLLQMALKPPLVPCKLKCEVTARDCLPVLLAAMPYLQEISLLIVCDISKECNIKPSDISCLWLSQWRPNNEGIKTVLDFWSVTCPHLVEPLLLSLDYTPNTGVSLCAQLAIGKWLCSWIVAQPTYTTDGPEGAWKVLRKMHLHRTEWGLSLDAPDLEEEPSDLFSYAYAILSGPWGHCIPLICSSGVDALLRIAKTRPLDAVPCLGLIMVVMSCSPDSIAATPQFFKIIDVILSSGPTLVQKAFGMGSGSGLEFLATMLFHYCNKDLKILDPSLIMTAWITLLWQPKKVNTCALLDVALLTGNYRHLAEAHANDLIMMDQDLTEKMIKQSQFCPVLSSAALRSHVASEMKCGLRYKLIEKIYLQRANKEKIHIDNALKKINWVKKSENLAIYQAGYMALISPLKHPETIVIWSTLMQLYLERPNQRNPDSFPPIGVLFHSGIIKSLTLSQLKSRLTELINYHHNRIDVLKLESNKIETEPNVHSPTAETLKTTNDSEFFPVLTIADFTGKTSTAESDSDCDTSEKESISSDDDFVSIVEPSNVATTVNNSYSEMISYHVGAERLMAEYLKWLQEGEKCRALPYHADFYRFISADSMTTAYEYELKLQRKIKTPTTDQSSIEKLPVKKEQNIIKLAVNEIMKIPQKKYRARSSNIVSPVEEVNFKSQRAVLSVVDGNLKELEKFAKESATEITRIRILDGKLWDLVGCLKVRETIPPVIKSCSKHCKPIKVIIPHEKWVTSVAAYQGIIENRSSALASLRRLTRPMPQVAKNAASFDAIARRVNDRDLAVALIERSFTALRDISESSPANSSLLTSLPLVTEKWICPNATLTADLITRWTRTARSCLQQSAVATLVSPAQYGAEWPCVYMALLYNVKQPHRLFTYLSKFEVSRWSSSLESSQRIQLLKDLIETTKKIGPAPDEDHTILLQILGVHIVVLTCANSLPFLITSSMKAAVKQSLPPDFMKCLVSAASKHADSMNFDELGHLLRDLGAIWWETRNNILTINPPRTYYCYAQQLATLFTTLQRSFVAIALSNFQPERVATCTWSSLQECWSPWVCPPSPLLIPPDNQDVELKKQFNEMIKHFVKCIEQIIEEYPLIRNDLLQNIFEWGIQTYWVSNSDSSRHASDLSPMILEALLTLQWQDQWFHVRCIQILYNVCTSKDVTLSSWCAMVLSHTDANMWLNGATDETIAAHMAVLLYLFTSMDFSTQLLDEATLLPWWRLPEQVLDQAFERFLVEHHDPSMPYHQQRHFRVILSASSLVFSPHWPDSYKEVTHRLRCFAISHYTRAMSNIALIEHTTAHTENVLSIIQKLAPYIQSDELKVEELLSRAIVIMCIEPAASKALLVWIRWVQSASARLQLACVSAASGLTTAEYFGALTDASIKAYMTNKECDGWPSVCPRLRSTPWSDLSALVSRGRLHSACGVALSGNLSARNYAAACLAIADAATDYVVNELILSLWLCIACRRSCTRNIQNTTECARDSPEDEEDLRHACALMANKWGEEQKTSLLRVVTMKSNSDRPTIKLRLLSKLSLCILSPSSENTKAYESLCATVFGTNPGEASSWGRSTRLMQLPRLATRLLPEHERYFRLELDLAEKVN